MPQVAIIMGSKNDADIVRPAAETLKKFGVSYEAHVMSAHRTPVEAHEFSSAAAAKGFKVIIAAAGKAAHLAGVVAANTVLPVIALPVHGTSFVGFDSLLSMVQMPAGIPVACVAVNGAENAGLLAVQMLALSDKKLYDKLIAFKKEMADKIIADDKAMGGTL